jgi:hypothetical protein
MDAKLESIKKNETFMICDLPGNQKVIGCHWVYKIKQNQDGSVSRYKARLVVKGYSQQYGINYEETFAPVAKFTSIWILLLIAAAMDMEIHQMDVQTAFLNGDLEEEMYMSQPEGYNHGPTKVWKLRKALYGLKQASRMWYRKIDLYMKHCGFTRCSQDHSVYTNTNLGLIIALYVDDLIILGRRQNELIEFKKKILMQFKMN